MGLSAQVAFSSLLAFFPAMVFLVGLLDLFGAYDALKEFLAPVAPGDVLTTIDTLQKDTSDRGPPSSRSWSAPPARSGRRAAR